MDTLLDLKCKCSAIWRIRAAVNSFRSSAGRLPLPAATPRGRNPRTLWSCCRIWAAGQREPSVLINRRVNFIWGITLIVSNQHATLWPRNGDTLGKPASPTFRCMGSYHPVVRAIAMNWILRALPPRTGATRNHAKRQWGKWRHLL